MRKSLSDLLSEIHLAREYTETEVLVYSWLYHDGPDTATAAADALELPYKTIRAALGTLEDLGDVICAVCGCENVWRVTR